MKNLFSLFFSCLILCLSQNLLAMDQLPRGREKHKINWVKAPLSISNALKYKGMTDNFKPLFKLRFAVQNKKIEKKRMRISKWLAIAEYQRAISDTDGYKNFSQGIMEPKFWEEIPIMSKDNYIKIYPVEQRVHGNVIPDSKITWDTSSGSSGIPTLWPRHEKERKRVAKRLELALKLSLPGKDVTLINGFALGQWATGTTIAGITMDGVNKINAGDNPKTWLSQIRALGALNHSSNHIFLLATYPPFLNKFVDIINEDPEYKNNGGARAFLKKYPIHAITGGEGIVEKNRQNLLALGFKKIWSTYGASDLSINIGGETDFERDLRKELSENIDMRRALFGEKRALQDAPMVFHFDPLEFYIEEHEETGSLLFTCMNDKFEPRIRYDLKDQGTVILYHKVMAVLEKFGKTYQSKVNLPLLFIWDRGENGVTFLGSNLYPANLINTLETNVHLKNAVERLAYHQYEKGQENELDILVELKSGVIVDRDQQKELHAQIIEGLKQNNEDFRGIQEKQSRAPGMRLYRHMQSPMHEWAAKPGSKHKYVFRGNEVGL